MIADRLAQSVALAYAARSKQERGYALSAKQAVKPVRGGVIDLDPEVSTGAAFQTIGLSCLDHAVANDRAVRKGDAEGTHQMRVGLRRLRAAISVFKELLQGPETEAIKTELKWLTEQLGPARDFQVLVEQRVRLRGERRRSPLRSACSSGIWMQSGMPGSGGKKPQSTAIVIGHNGSADCALARQWGVVERRRALDGCAPRKARG
jgi:inorganic triphosphatase YgiF